MAKNLERYIILVGITIGWGCVEWIGSWLQLCERCWALKQPNYNKPLTVMTNCVIIHHRRGVGGGNVSFSDMVFCFCWLV